jgi:putative Holliday junction resolvase
MRWMGLDIGERRIGLAYANFLEMGSSIVVPGGFLEVQDRQMALEDLADLADEEGITAVIAGLPLRDGFESRQCQHIKAFLKDLQALLPPAIGIYLWDESLTSVAAGQMLVEAGLNHSKGSRKKGRVDAVAATLILQSFVDAHRGHLPPVGVIA